MVFYGTSFDFEDFILGKFNGVVFFDLDLVMSQWKKMNILARTILNSNLDKETILKELLMLEMKCRLYVDYFTDEKLLTKYSVEEIIERIELEIKE